MSRLITMPLPSLPLNRVVALRDRNSQTLQPTVESLGRITSHPDASGSFLLRCEATGLARSASFAFGDLLAQGLGISVDHLCAPY